MIISKKNQFLLINANVLNKKIFNLIIKNIPSSIFSKIDFFFFKNAIESKKINLYLIKKRNKISSIISTVSVSNYRLLQRSIFFYLLKNPIKILTNFKFFLNLLDRDSNEIDSKNEKKYLHLLHLIIFKKQFINNSLKAKDDIINYFFRKILNKNGANFLYLCYEKENIQAHKYYKRNKFKIYKKNRSTIFIKKKVT